MTKCLALSKDDVRKIGVHFIFPLYEFVVPVKDMQ